MTIRLFGGYPYAVSLLLIQELLAPVFIGLEAHLVAFFAYGCTKHIVAICCMQTTGVWPLLDLLKRALACSIARASVEPQDFRWQEARE